MALGSPSYAKSKPTIQIRVVETQTSTRQTVYETPGKAAESTSNCDIDISVTGTSGTASCKTTTTPSNRAAREHCLD